MGKTKPKRTPRFVRVPDRKIQLQERDRQIILNVFKYRFLGSDQITALASGSPQGILRRLNLLFHNSYLDRPREQLRYDRLGEPMIYGLGIKGAEFLIKEYGVKRARVDWTTKNREAGRAYIDHVLLVADFMVCIELAVRQIKNLELIDQNTIISQMKPRGKHNPLSWRGTYRVNSGRSSEKRFFNVYPDRAFGFHFTDEPPKTNKSYFFLEADRSTMPIKRKNPIGTSYQKKMLGYFLSWKHQMYQKIFGFNSVRVLTIAKTNERINNMIQAGKEIDPRGKGLRIFLFLKQSEIRLNDPGRLLLEVWRNGHGKGRVDILN